jgi:hypothetical protein
MREMMGMIIEKIEEMRKKYSACIDFNVCYFDAEYKPDVVFPAYDFNICLDNMSKCDLGNKLEILEELIIKDNLCDVWDFENDNVKVVLKNCYLDKSLYYADIEFIKLGIKIEGKKLESYCINDAIAELKELAML